MKNRKLLIASAITTFVMIAVMVMHGAPLKIDGITPYGIVDLELAGTPDKALDIYNAWGMELRNRALANTLIDFLFILSYGALLFCLVKTVARSYSGAWYTAGKWFSIAVIVAACFDGIENILMIKTLKGSMGKELIASTFMFAFAKFFLLALSILYILVSFAGRLLYKRNLPVHQLSQNSF